MTAPHPSMGVLAATTGLPLQRGPVFFPPPEFRASPPPVAGPSTHASARTDVDVIEEAGYNRQSLPSFDAEAAQFHSTPRQDEAGLPPSRASPEAGSSAQPSAEVEVQYEFQSTSRQDEGLFSPSPPAERVAEQGSHGWLRGFYSLPGVNNLSAEARADESQGEEELEEEEQLEEEQQASGSASGVGSVFSSISAALGRLSRFGGHAVPAAPPPPPPPPPPPRAPYVPAHPFDFMHEFESGTAQQPPQPVVTQASPPMGYTAWHALEYLGRPEEPGSPGLT